MTLLTFSIRLVLKSLLLNTEEKNTLIKLLQLGEIQDIKGLIQIFLNEEISRKKIDDKYGRYFQEKNNLIQNKKNKTKTIVGSNIKEQLGMND